VALLQRGFVSPKRRSPHGSEMRGGDAMWCEPRISPRLRGGHPGCALARAIGRRLSAHADQRAFPIHDVKQRSLLRSRGRCCARVRPSLWRPHSNRGDASCMRIAVHLAQIREVVNSVVDGSRRAEGWGEGFWRRCRARVQRSFAISVAKCVRPGYFSDAVCAAGGFHSVT
jgi:hypothetical protein